MLTRISLIFTILVHFSYSSETKLKVLQDDDLMNLIKSETYIVCLFSSQDCESCNNLERILLDVKEELDNSLNGQLVKVVDSQLARLYSPTREPVLVFFRHGVPLLYNGQANGDLILDTFLDNKAPTVKELTDETFEHLTQVATGATTGDWFVMFYAPECVDCHRLQARWEAVGAQLKNRVNLARMNKATTAASTAKRFGVTNTPTFILFRHGKLYRYQIQKYDIASFISFAHDWYKNMKPERIPLPKSPFDEFVEKIADALYHNSFLWQISLLTTLFATVLLIFIKYQKINNRHVEEPVKKTKKEK